MTYRYPRLINLQMHCVDQGRPAADPRLQVEAQRSREALPPGAPQTFSRRILLRPEPCANSTVIFSGSFSQKTGVFAGQAPGSSENERPSACLTTAVRTMLGEFWYAILPLQVKAMSGNDGAAPC